MHVSSDGDRRRSNRATGRRAKWEEALSHTRLDEREVREVHSLMDSKSISLNVTYFRQRPRPVPDSLGIVEMYNTKAIKHFMRRNKTN